MCERNHTLPSYHQVLAFLLHIATIQKLLAQHRVLVRGAVTVGKLFHRENILFGPGMNEVYILETTSAKFPRIILSEKMISVLNSDAGQYEILFEGGLGLLVNDTDGKVFLGYDGHGLHELIPETSDNLKEKKRWMISTFENKL